MDITTFSNFVGCHLSADELETLAAKNIKPKWRRKDAELSAWWDYRTMHPASRTLLFYHAWEEAVTTFLRIYHGVERSYFTPLWARNKPMITANWVARQTADEREMPYDTYSWGALLAGDTLGWERLPSVNQSYSDSILELIEAHWGEIKQSKLPLRKDLLDADAADSDLRTAFQESRIQQLASRPPMALGFAIGVSRWIDESICRAIMGDELTDACLNEVL